jgi:hypothetical protein
MFKPDRKASPEGGERFRPSVIHVKRESPQNGFTITAMTMTIISTVGISLTAR